MSLNKLLSFFGYTYLMNKRTEEVHDLNNIKLNCGCDKMSKKNKKYITKRMYKKLKSTPNSKVNGCRHCMPNEDTD